MTKSATRLSTPETTLRVPFQYSELEVVSESRTGKHLL